MWEADTFGSLCLRAHLLSCKRALGGGQLKANMNVKRILSIIQSSVGTLTCRLQPCNAKSIRGIETTAP
jgi:hypothetical protein